MQNHLYTLPGNVNKEFYMAAFDDREKGYESKFARDEEMNFKIGARRNKLLGLWAAEKLGKTGDLAMQYAKDVVIADFERDGIEDVVEKVLGDFAAAGITLTADDIHKEMHRLLPVARQEILGTK
jgi:hypothetical protein